MFTSNGVRRALNFVIPQNSAWQFFFNFLLHFAVNAPSHEYMDINKSVFDAEMLRYNNISIKIRLGLSKSRLD